MKTSGISDILLRVRTPARNWRGCWRQRRPNGGQRARPLGCHATVSHRRAETLPLLRLTGERETVKDSTPWSRRERAVLYSIKRRTSAMLEPRNGCGDDGQSTNQTRPNPALDVEGCPFGTTWMFCLFDSYLCPLSSTIR